MLQKFSVMVLFEAFSLKDQPLKIREKLHFGFSLSNSGPVRTRSHYRLREMIY